MPGLTPEEQSAIRLEQSSARSRQLHNRQMMGSMYDHMMGTPQDPKDHPANNISHPHGNRGLSHATVPLNVPTSTPSSTGDYQDEINY